MIREFWGFFWEFSIAWESLCDLAVQGHYRQVLLVAVLARTHCRGGGWYMQGTRTLHVDLESFFWKQFFLVDFLSAEKSCTSKNHRKASDVKVEISATRHCMTASMTRDQTYPNLVKAVKRPMLKWHAGWLWQEAQRFYWWENSTRKSCLRTAGRCPELNPHYHTHLYVQSIHLSLVYVNIV